MNIRVPALATVLALPILLAALPAEAQQDTTRAGEGQMRRARSHAPEGMRGMRGTQGMQGMRGMAGMRGGGHMGPRVLIGLKDELELTEDQVAQLEKIQEGYQALMPGIREQMQAQREALMKARSENDWDALEVGIDEGARLRAAMAKSMIEVERQALGVLNDEQRQKFETWKEGARLFRRQGMRGRAHVRGQGPGRGMQQGQGNQ